MNNIFIKIKNYNMMKFKLQTAEKIIEEFIQENTILNGNNEIINNIIDILNDSSTLLFDTYYIKEKLYGMFIKVYSYYNNSIELYTYCLNSKIVVCRSAMINEFSNTNIHNCHIESIDSYEYRKGHGSKHIQKLISIAKEQKVNRIYGELLMTTNIGIDNLRKFYESNGFTTNNDSFYLILK